MKSRKIKVLVVESKPKTARTSGLIPAASTAATGMVSAIKTRSARSTVTRNEVHSWRAANSASVGSMATHTPLFVTLLIGTIILVGVLCYVPALALGPVIEHLNMIKP